jgi:hypothetical protein
VQVARYAAQAVLTANIDEARYRVLAALDGKLLIQARYAVRNNQRSFLKVVLPADAAVWSSAVAGRPVRAGLGPDGSLLFPLSKGRAGEDAPAFAVEFVYLTRAAGWAPKGRASITLPAADLPISRAGLSLYYPPGYRLAPDVGAFRVQEFEPATATALNAHPPAPLPASAAPSTIVAAKSTTPVGSTQALVDSYRNSTGARRTSLTLPAGLSFPALGPSLFFVSELNGEGKAATIAFEYQQVKGGAQ